MGNVKFLGRGKIPKLIESYFEMCFEYTIIIHIFEAILLVKIIIKLFYNMKNLYTAFLLITFYV